MQKTLAITFLIFILISCKVANNKQSDKVKVNKNDKINYDYNVYSKFNSNCVSSKIGELITLKVCFHNDEGVFLRDTNITLSVNDFSNGLLWNKILANQRSCDSVVVLGNKLNKLIYPSDCSKVSVVIKKKELSSCISDSSFYKILNNQEVFNFESLNQKDYNKIEYQDTIIYSNKLVINNKYWLAINPQCIDTVIYDIENDIEWLKQWELLRYPNSFFGESLTDSLKNVYKTDSVNSVQNVYFIYELRVQTKEKKVIQDNYEWDLLEDGLFMKKIKIGKGNSATVGKWIKINYSIFNQEKDLLYSSSNYKPYFFYIGDDAVPLSWNKVLVNAKVGDVIAVKSNFNLAYGKKGLLPLVDSYENVYFEFEVLGVQ